MGSGCRHAGPDRRLRTAAVILLDEAGLTGTEGCCFKHTDILTSYIGDSQRLTVRCQPDLPFCSVVLGTRKRPIAVSYMVHPCVKSAAQGVVRQCPLPGSPV